MSAPLRTIARGLLAGLLVAPPSALGQSAGELVASGDSLMAAFETRAAIEAFRAGIEGYPDDPTLHWKAARALSNLADETPGEEGDEERYEASVELAWKAVELAPRAARPHATLAAVLGKLALFRGGKRKVELAREVHEHARRAIGLDPQDFAGFVVLGAWHREVAKLNFFLRTFAANLFGGLPDASLETSASLLRRAVRLAPRYVTPRLELARTYVEIDREEAAIEELRRALDAPVRERLDEIQKKRARQLLGELRGG